MGRLGRAAAAACAACALALGLGCASSSSPGVAIDAGDGAIHVVRPGENLYRISRFYGVSVDRLVRANRIRDVTELAVGQRLLIPGAGRDQPGHGLGTPGGGDGGPGGRELARREADLNFVWPLSGRVSSKFGWRRGRRHEGIDIPAPKGTPVRAAESGRVIHSGRLGAYGNVVILKHAGRYSSVYAHNSKNRVRKGQFVEKGDVVAVVGRSGNATGAHLHFEVRRDRVAHDPLGYLPGAGVTARR